MKRFLRTALMSLRFLFLILLPLAVTMEQEYCRPEDYTNVAIPFRSLYEDVCPLIKNILSEATYDFQIHCSQKCLQNPFCAGYNFKKKHEKKIPNCQLTHTLDHNFYVCNADDKGWIFYHPVVARKVPCHKMKNCKNGGKTIIDLKGGPGSDPYRCECPKGFSGDLCQIRPVPTLSVDSVILYGEPADFLKILTSWTGNTTTNWTLCWRATKHGWAASIFHGNCDDKKPTVTIIKVGNFTFGGYATASWEGSPQYKKGPGSFIFSLRNKENLAPFKAPLKDQNTPYAIYTCPDYGPTFGSFDIYIIAPSLGNSHTYFNDDYQAPSGVSDPKTILAGTYYFTPSEIEVFYLV